MGMVCKQCGKTIEGEGIAFCPYCGGKLEVPAETGEPRNPEAEKWVDKALAVKNYPERKKILLKGLEACPDSLEIAWELLFVGEDPPKRSRFMDFSIIKCWILEIYRKPGEIPAAKREQMRSQFFDDPQLIQTLNRFEHPEDKQREYIQRLCKEYVELFLEGSNQVMGNIFGFHIDRNKEKKLAVPVAEMIARIKKDEKLSPDQREQLWKGLYQGYAAHVGGKTEYLDELIDN